MWEYDTSARGTSVYEREFAVVCVVSDAVVPVSAVALVISDAVVTDAEEFSVSLLFSFAAQAKRQTEIITVRMRDRNFFIVISFFVFAFIQYIENPRGFAEK